MTDTEGSGGESVEEVHERMSDAFVALDEGWTITDHNESFSELFAGSVTDLCGESIWAVAPEWADSDVAEALQRAMAAGDTVSLDAEYGSDELLFGIRAYPAEAAVYVYLRDKSQEARVERLNERLRILNRIMRHDIRSDMNIILGWSQELESHLDEAGMKMRERIERTGQHVVDLTEILRDFIRLLGSEGTPELKPVNLGRLLEDEITTRRISYPRATFSVDGDVPDVQVEANELLSSVFRNILNNAVQHADVARPAVTIRVDTTPQTVRVRIADNGPGLPPGREDEVFGRTEEGLDCRETSIGLYLVDTLVEDYGGRVWYEENDPRGTVFWVELSRASTD